MEEKNEQSLSNDIANTGKEAAKAVLGLAKAGVKAATGNVVGAAVDVVKNPKLLRAVIAAVLAVVLMLSMCLLLFGAAIIAVINAFIKLVEESWNEQWEEEGISSGGSVLYLYSVGLLKAGVGTIGSVADKLLSSDKGASNSAVDSNSVTYTEKDYDNAIASIHDQKALAGRNSVLHKHLNMIQLRVEQRGQQMISYVTGQYALNSIGLAIFTALRESEFAYLMRRNFSTHLYLAGMDDNGMSYMVGHRLYQDPIMRDENNHPDLLYPFMKFLELRPIINKISDIQIIPTTQPNHPARNPRQAIILNLYHQKYKEVIQDYLFTLSSEN